MILSTIRLIATDIDGTLVRPDGRLSDHTKHVLRQAHAQGIEVVLVTGLNPWVVRRYIREIGTWTLAISLNGTFTLEDGEVVSGLFIDPTVAREAVSVILAHGYVPLVYGEDHITRYLPSSSEAMQEVTVLIAERPYQPFVSVSSTEALLAARPAQLSVCDTPGRTAMLYPPLAQALGDRAYVVHQPGRRSWVEVNHPQARKSTALLALAQRKRISSNEILYFGDSLNDLPVFQSLPYTVAMENARPEVKGLARWITRPNAEDGVAHFLVHRLGLLPG